MLHFNRHTNRRADFYPTLNQTRFALSDSEMPGALDVFLETETPNFSVFQVRFDEAPWVETACRFDWELHPGLNVMRVRSVNTCGREGIVSCACLWA